MNWYYSNNAEERLGPVDDAEFSRLIATGQIGDNTLVWCHQLTDWKPLNEARTLLGIASGVSDRPLAQCAECGRWFPGEDMVDYDNMKVCAACKPVFFQKIREGVNIGGGFNYAGFWIRLGAHIIDYLILNGVGFAVGFAFARLEAEGAGSAMAMLVSFGIEISYATFFIGKTGQTPGKMALGIKVVRPDGSRVSYARAFGRYFAKILSGLVLCIGYIMAGTDEEKRALHDRICDTRVIRIR